MLCAMHNNYYTQYTHNITYQCAVQCKFEVHKYARTYCVYVYVCNCCSCYDASWLSSLNGVLSVEALRYIQLS